MTNRMPCICRKQLSRAIVPLIAIALLAISALVSPAQEPAPAAALSRTPRQLRLPPSRPARITFTPGDTILFSDDFTSTQDGGSRRWELVAGRASPTAPAKRPSSSLTRQRRDLPRCPAHPSELSQCSLHHRFESASRFQLLPLCSFSRSPSSEGYLSFAHGNLGIWLPMAVNSPLNCLPPWPVPPFSTPGVMSPSPSKARK